MLFFALKKVFLARLENRFLRQNVKNLRNFPWFDSENRLKTVFLKRKKNKKIKNTIILFAINQQVASKKQKK